MTHSQPLKLLLSAFAFRTWGARIEATAPGRLSFVTADDALAADGPSTIGGAESAGVSFPEFFSTLQGIVR